MESLNFLRLHKKNFTCEAIRVAEIWLNYTTGVQVCDATKADFILQSGTKKFKKYWTVSLRGVKKFFLVVLMLLRDYCQQLSQR